MENSSDTKPNSYQGHIWGASMPEWIVLKQTNTNTRITFTLTLIIEVPR